jgi:hypothetical protein
MSEGARTSQTLYKCKYLTIGPLVLPLESVPAPSSSGVGIGVRVSSRVPSCDLRALWTGFPWSNGGDDRCIPQAARAAYLVGAAVRSTDHRPHSAYGGLGLPGGSCSTTLSTYQVCLPSRLSPFDDSLVTQPSSRDVSVLLLFLLKVSATPSTTVDATGQPLLAFGFDLGQSYG